MFKRVLVAIDGSICAQHGLPAAIKVMQTADIPVLVVRPAKKKAFVANGAVGVLRRVNKEE